MEIGVATAMCAARRRSLSASLLYTTWPDAETARAAARDAVEGGHAACVNVFAPHLAFYRWQGAIEEAEEVAALFKCAADRATALRDWIAERHPYDLPAIVALEAGAASSSAYLAWIGAPETPQRPVTSNAGPDRP
jgi:periplasmic divalent cation tolerance protein